MLDLNKLWAKGAHWLAVLSLLFATYWGVFDARAVNASQTTMARALYQASPLAAPAQGAASPLATPAVMVTSAPAIDTGGSQTSLILVGIVLLGVLFIIALVMWRQKQR